MCRLRPLRLLANAVVVVVLGCIAAVDDSFPRCEHVECVDDGGFLSSPTPAFVPNLPPRIPITRLGAGEFVLRRCRRRHLRANLPVADVVVLARLCARATRRIAHISPDLTSTSFSELDASSSTSGECYVDRCRSSACRLWRGVSTRLVSRLPRPSARAGRLPAPHGPLPPLPSPFPVSDSDGAKVVTMRACVVVDERQHAGNASATVL